MHVEGHLQSFYQHGHDVLVKFSPLYGGLWLTFNDLQFCSVHAFINNGHSLKNMRFTCAEWMQRFKDSAIVTILEGHTTVETGEILYSPPGRKQNYFDLPHNVRLPVLKSGLFDFVNV